MKKVTKIDDGNETKIKKKRTKLLIFPLYFLILSKTFTF